MTCDLCFGDRWITDTFHDFMLLDGKDEERRFKERIGVLKGAAEGRMACPRCQPNWQMRRSIKLS